ncbi:hypothetical protein KP509_04G036700 [Ceratopteris richardii]|uniref:CCHC-type domain-containing protein n=1 Tax=Ceratopteris richardii TaxID=49495 RepID=A0A8T2UZL1_CERRI|nr:hypothetical protein KP509_04G036700 [Ceratopteris richardii]
MAGIASSADTKNLFEIRKFDGNAFDLWKDRMQGILFLKDCEDALTEHKPAALLDEDWAKMNKKAITYIKMAVTDEILVDIKGLQTAYAVWEKLKVNLKLDECKPASEHLNAFTSILSQLQDAGLPPFDPKLKAIFLLMTLPDSWEALVVSLSNNPHLTFDGVRGSILNEEIRRKSSGENSGSAYNVRGRTLKKPNTGNKPRNRSKRKEKQQDVSCYQCGRKGHKKPDCRYYKKELERKKQANAKGKKNENDGSSNSKDIEKANMFTWGITMHVILKE